MGLGSLCMQSPDGDIIHCVPSHRQPAFDHPKLRGQKPEVNHLPPPTSSACAHFTLPFLFLPPARCVAHQMSSCNVHTSSSSRLQDEPVVRPVPKGGGAAEEEAPVLFQQAWSDGGERCPEGTVPIRRTTARDVKRARSASRFGMKPRASNARRDSTSSGHEVSRRLTFTSPRHGRLHSS